MKRLIPLCALIVACSDSTDPQLSEGLFAVIAVGDQQHAPVTEQLPDSIMVAVTNAARAPVPSLTVGFAVVTTGGGEPFLPTVLTDSLGMAKNFWTLGTVAGEHGMEVRAIVEGVPVILDTVVATADVGELVSFQQLTTDTLLTLPATLALEALLAGADAYGNEATVVPAVDSVSSARLSVTANAIQITEEVGDTVWFSYAAYEGETIVRALRDLAPLAAHARNWCPGVAAGVDSTVIDVTSESLAYRDDADLDDATRTRAAGWPVLDASFPRMRITYYTDGTADTLAPWAMRVIQRPDTLEEMLSNGIVYQAFLLLTATDPVLHYERTATCGEPYQWEFAAP